MSEDGTRAGTGLVPRYQEYKHQKCFIAYSGRAERVEDLLSACRQVLTRPEFDLELDSASGNFDPDVPLRQKTLELIANARYGIYDLSHWRDEHGRWHPPNNVYIELGMAVALNRPALLLRHAGAPEFELPECLKGMGGHVLEYGGETTLMKELERRLPQWLDAPPERDWWNRYCVPGGRKCEFREAHPRARRWGGQTLSCHISDGIDPDRVDFRTVVEDVLGRFSDVGFDYLDALPPARGYDFLLCSRCQAVRSTPFAIYRITPSTPAETFIVIGISLALEHQFDYKIPKLLLVDKMQDLPSLLSGYEVVVAHNDQQRREHLRRYLPAVLQKVRAANWKPRPLPFIDLTHPRAEDIEPPAEEVEPPAQEPTTPDATGVAPVKVGGRNTLVGVVGTGTIKLGPVVIQAREEVKGLSEEQQVTVNFDPVEVVLSATGELPDGCQRLTYGVVEAIDNTYAYEHLTVRLDLVSRRPAEEGPPQPDRLLLNLPGSRTGIPISVARSPREAGSQPLSVGDRVFVGLASFDVVAVPAAKPTKPLDENLLSTLEMQLRQARSTRSRFAAQLSDTEQSIKLAEGVLLTTTNAREYEMAIRERDNWSTRRDMLETNINELNILIEQTEKAMFRLLSSAFGKQSDRVPSDSEIEAALSRDQGHTRQAADKVSMGGAAKRSRQDIRIDEATGVVLVNGTRVKLSKLSLKLLIDLYRHASEPRTRKQLYKSVYEEDYDETNYSHAVRLKTLVQRLRKSIEEDPSQPRFILTVFPGVYKLVLEPGAE